jgi:hypothetical protein
MTPTRLLPLFACAAIACAPVTDNRLYDEDSAGFRSALVLPLNVIAKLPDDLAPGSERVEDALRDYLQEHGKDVRTISYADARGAWRESVDQCRREQGNCDDFAKPARYLALHLAQAREHELLIIPYLRFREAKNCAEHVHWDQVERPVEKTGPGLYEGAPVDIEDADMRAVSLEIYALGRDGERVFEGDGGIEVVDRIYVPKAPEQIVAEPRENLYENPAWIREGVAISLWPLIPSPEVHSEERMRRIVLVGLMLALVAAGTYLAGEQTEVAVLRTYDSEGLSYDTRLWVVDYDGVPWVRVAKSERNWFQRLLADPRAEIVRAGIAREVIAHPEDSAETRARIDSAFRAKYGVVDWWYGLLLRRDAIPVRLDPA